MGHLQWAVELNQLHLIYISIDPSHCDIALKGQLH